MDRAGGGRGADDGGGGGAAGGVDNPEDGRDVEEGGSGGAVGGVEILEGGRGAEAGGGGGAEGGVGGFGVGRRLDDDGNRGGAGAGDGALNDGGGIATVEGFLDVIGGGGGFAAPGSGGGARGGRSECVLCAGFGGGLRRLATNGFSAAAGCGGDDSVVRGVGLNAFNLGAVGGFGAEEVGGFGADCLEVSESDTDDDSLSAPVSTPPPVLFSFGIPTPAKMPPN